MLLGHEKEVEDFAVFVHKKNPELDIEAVRRMIQVLSFFWTIHNIEGIVGALNKPEIRPVVEEVVAKANTPAYDLIGYFLRLDTVEQFSDSERRQLKKLWDKHQYEFFRKVISIRTQSYLNTHKVSHACRTGGLFIIGH